ncbi:hypothetical protein [Microvirga lenta]|uniref:hypothetical protein n=1 Tax=Microvirga lenta TaxID=2881337 RepID=UPI001CFFC833|nr:hypothetical protein [Microvirga lenta]MCB5175259.1 hypothetical protein [Microvirga lenta]
MRIHDFSDDDCSDASGKKDRVVSVLRSELINRVLRLPDETRAKLLAFLHLVDDLRLVDADLQVDPGGEIRMMMFSRKDPRAKPRLSRGSAAEPLQ